MPVKVNHDDWGRPWATPCPTNGSGDFTALAHTDGFVELPPGPAEFAKSIVTPRAKGGRLPDGLKVEGGRVWWWVQYPDREAEWVVVPTAEETDVLGLAGGWVDPWDRG